MFRVDLKGPNRLDIEFGGKLDSDEMRAALDELVEKSEGIERGRMLYRIGEFRMPTVGAIGIELARMPKMFKFIRKFERAAVLARQDWIKTISEIEGKLIPGLEIKAFNLDQEAEAEAWLEG